MNRINMTKPTDAHSFQLTKDQVLSLDGSTLQIHCVRGCLWITWPDGNERVLKKGQTVRVVSTGVICIQAFSDSAIALNKLKSGHLFWVRSNERRFLWPVIASRTF